MPNKVWIVQEKPVTVKRAADDNSDIRERRQLELKYALQDLGEECKKLQAEVAVKRDRILELEQRRETVCVTISIEKGIITWAIELQERKTLVSTTTDSPRRKALPVVAAPAPLSSSRKKMIQSVYINEGLRDLIANSKGGRRGWLFKRRPTNKLFNRYICSSPVVAVLVLSE